MDLKEQRQLRQAWDQALHQARKGNIPRLDPPPRQCTPNGISARAARQRRAAIAEATSARAYWAAYHKCAACPGPHRRHANHPIGQGPNLGHTPYGEIT